MSAEEADETEFRHQEERRPGGTSAWVSVSIAMSKGASVANESVSFTFCGGGSGLT